MTVLALQKRLAASGFNPGAIDGIMGPATLRAINAALDKLPIIVPEEPAPIDAGIVPDAWMPWARMERIIVHWNAGGHKASALDKKHYHIIIESDGRLVRGDKSIADNASTADGVYAAHTLNLNAGSIAVMICGMAGAKESPFAPGKFPITKTEWDKLPAVLADLCRRYNIPVTRETVLTHAEVQPTLGVKQRGKWDITRLPWDPGVRGHRAVGDQMRAGALMALTS